VRTYGCQMNVHDSERISGLLDEAGYAPVPDGSTPDVVVFNTCAVRENADNRLYGNLGHLKPVKDRTPGMQIAVSAAGAGGPGDDPQPETMSGSSRRVRLMTSSC
jgi:tRNA-2-methylthio-N6-dimethylallyladenosine synthase